jgi:hypothetical protein
LSKSKKPAHHPFAAREPRGGRHVLEAAGGVAEELLALHAAHEEVGVAVVVVVGDRGRHRVALAAQPGRLGHVD